MTSVNEYGIIDLQRINEQLFAVYLLADLQLNRKTVYFIIIPKKEKIKNGGKAMTYEIHRIDGNITLVNDYYKYLFFVDTVKIIERKTQKVIFEK